MWVENMFISISYSVFQSYHKFGLMRLGGMYQIAMYVYEVWIFGV